jgi:peptidyl-prolyl cis-trans isomerase SurA
LKVRSMSQHARQLLPGILVVLALCTARPSAEVIEQILVKVNGEILTKTDLEQRQVQAIRAKGIQPADDGAMKKAIEEVTPEIVANAVDEMLLTQKGKELGYKLSDEEFDRVVSNIRKENKLDTDEAFQAALKQEGMTLSDLRKSLERQMLMSRVTQNEVMSKVGINEEEARKYHANHLKDFTTPGTVTIREILVRVVTDSKGVNVGADEDAKAKAEAARKRVLAGEGFEQVAAEVSSSASRANGGLVGPLNTNELTPGFRQMLDGMKVGDVSEVIRGQGGYQVIKLDTRTDDKVMTAEEAHDKIADALYEEKRVGEMKRYLAKLRAQAIIEWKNDEIRKAWETRMAAEPPLPPDPTGPPPAATPEPAKSGKPAKPVKPTD